jgi:chaperone LolA
MTGQTVTRLFVLISLMILTVPALPARGDDADAVLARVQKKYDSIRDASIDFSRTIRFAALQTEESFAGKFFMKRGKKYRIEGDEQTIVTDGTTVWTYTRSTAQVVIDNYKDDPHSLTPDNLLVNIPKQYQAAILDETKGQGGEVVVLKLIPTDEHAQVKWMKAWIHKDDWLMHRVQVEDLGENLTTYTLTAIHLNRDTPDSLFRFSAPAGVEVIDLR